MAGFFVGIASYLSLGALASSTGNSSAISSCNLASSTLSPASGLFWPGTTQYDQDVSHYYNSSSEVSVCSVEPGTGADVGKLLHILGTSRSKFGIKSGGHAYNPHFSSSPGVEISLSRFNSIQYHSENQTVEVGAGLVWDDVYAALQPYGVTVLGGRVPGIGVGGFTLGGGYSWHTNQFGLAVDNVIAVEIALPNGTVATISDEFDPNLFHAVKGGYNNFGVVTKFTLKTHPQGQAWGGNVFILGNYSSEFNAATTKFLTEVTDPKAAIIASYTSASGQSIVSVLLFYDGPEPPSGVFDDFLAIPAFSSNVGTKSFLEVVQSTALGPAAPRAVEHTLPLAAITPDIIRAIQNETEFWGNRLLPYGVIISYSLEPFLPDILSHASVDSSAYPPSREMAFSPVAVTYQYTTADADAEVIDAVTRSVAHLVDVALALGQPVADAAFYGNYALAVSTPVEKIYREKLGALRHIKSVYDPHDVMGLTGGWKI